MTRKLYYSTNLTKTLSFWNVLQILCLSSLLLHLFHNYKNKKTISFAIFKGSCLSIAKQL